MGKYNIPIPEGELGNAASVPDLDTVDANIRVTHMELAHGAYAAQAEARQTGIDPTAILGDKVRAALASQAATIALKGFESFHPEVLGDVSGGTSPESAR